MTFEEQFPELKALTINGDSKYMSQCPDEDFITTSDIIRHCRSNQRIKEAIEKCSQRFGVRPRAEEGEKQDRFISKSDLLKELSLEELK